MIQIGSGTQCAPQYGCQMWYSDCHYISFHSLLTYDLLLYYRNGGELKKNEMLNQKQSVWFVLLITAHSTMSML